MQRVCIRRVHLQKYQRNQLQKVQGTQSIPSFFFRSLYLSLAPCSSSSLSLCLFSLSLTESEDMRRPNKRGISFAEACETKTLRDLEDAGTLQVLALKQRPPRPGT